MRAGLWSFLEAPGGESISRAVRRAAEFNSSRSEDGAPRAELAVGEGRSQLLEAPAFLASWRSSSSQSRTCPASSSLSYCPDPLFCLPLPLSGGPCDHARLTWATPGALPILKSLIRHQCSLAVQRSVAGSFPGAGCGPLWGHRSAHRCVPETGSPHSEHGLRNCPSSYRPQIQGDIPSPHPKGGGSRNV